MIYHTGYLPFNTDPMIERRRAYWLAEQEAGRVVLLQRRLGEFQYEYHALPVAKHQPPLPRGIVKAQLMAGR